MLHEVLLALIGVTGDVVTMSKDRRSFCVSSDIDFLDASEIALVQRLCRTGVEFRLLQQRVDWLRRLCTKAGVPTDSVEDMDEDAGVLMEDDGTYSCKFLSIVQFVLCTHPRVNISMSRHCAQYLPQPTS